MSDHTHRPVRAMIQKEGGRVGASYSEATTNGRSGEGFKRSSFEPLPDLRATLITEGTFKDREMDIDPEHPRAPAIASMPWLPGKCIPQAPQAPK
jgi:hypothetical protein